jgi:hypothetical protein
MFKMHGIVLGRGSMPPERLRNTALKDYGIMAKMFADNVLEVRKVVVVFLLVCTLNLIRKYLD